MIQQFNAKTPWVHPKSYVHPTAVLIGEVVIHEEVFIGPGAVLRGDLGPITVGRGSNIQDNCVVHSFPNEPVLFGRNSHVGHASVIHGATLHDDVLIGIKSVLLDGSIVGEGSIIGAVSLVLKNQIIEPGHMAFGQPAKAVRLLTDEERNWRSRGTEVYQELTRAYLAEGTNSAQERPPLSIGADHKPKT